MSVIKALVQWRGVGLKKKADETSSAGYAGMMEISGGYSEDMHVGKGNTPVGQVNSTAAFYRLQPVDLFTEHTICESLAREDSPYMIAISKPRAYGEIVGDLLYDNCPVNGKGRICEIGGGYGNLMKGLLNRYAEDICHVCMVDLSINLLKRQRGVLKQWKNKISFVNGNAHTIIPTLSGIDFFIINEVIGDLDTWTDLDARCLPEAIEKRVLRYGLTIPREGTFHINMGAICLVEDICQSGACAFISEHSCDPIIPEGMAYLTRDLSCDGYPREIRLKDHSEYTIRFEHLIKTAVWWGKRVITGSLIDLVGLEKTPRMRSIFVGRMGGSDTREIIYELLDHIREYRWMLIL